MKCRRCNYDWTNKVENPVECPRCKGRLDIVSHAGRREYEIIEKNGGEKPMTSRFGRIRAIVVIAIVAVGAWAVFGGAPATPPIPSGTASITGTVGPGTVFAMPIPDGNASGIENIYIIQHGLFENVENLSGHENILGVITADTGSVDIPYDNSFDIVVAVKAGSDNMAYVRIDNMNIALASYGAFGITDENVGDSSASYMAAWSHDNSGIDTGTGWLRINAYWDNDGNGYVLKAGQTLELENIILWCWG